jgi:hypothetical protein
MGYYASNYHRANYYGSNYYRPTLLDGPGFFIPVATSFFTNIFVDILE